MELRWDLLLPFILIQLVLMTIALIDLFRNQRTKESKWGWALAIVFVNILGPVLYFILGRRKE